MCPFSVREVRHRTALFPVVIRHTGEQVFYIRLYSDTTTNTRLRLLEAESFFARLQVEEVGYSIFFGILINCAQ